MDPSQTSYARGRRVLNACRDSASNCWHSSRVHCAKAGPARLRSVEQR